MANASLVLATRNAWMYQRDYDVENDLPADTVDFGADWEDYSQVGYTNGGIGVSVNVERASIDVDQLFFSVDRPITGGGVSFDTTLAEFSPENLLLASGIGELEDAVAPGAATRGNQDYTIGASFTESQFTIGWEAMQRNGEAFRALIYRALPTSTPNPRVGQADTHAQTAFEVEALPADDLTDHDLAIFRSIIPATGEE